MILALSEGFSGGINEMTTQVSTKVRLVRCPKCRQVLAELPEVLLYECGGCGTILQAKNRKRETNDTQLSSRVISNDDAKTREQDLSVEPKSSDCDSSTPHEEKPKSLDRDLRIPPEGEASLVKDNIENQDEGRHDALDVCKSERTSRDNKIEDEENKYDNNFQDLTEGRFLSDEFNSSSEEKDEASGEEEQGEVSCVNQHTTGDQSEGEGSRRASREGDCFLDEDRNMPEFEDQENDLPPGGGKYGKAKKDLEEDGYSQNSHHNEVLSGEKWHAGVDSSSTEIVVREINGSQSTEIKVDVDDGIEDFRTLEMRNNGKELKSSGEDSSPPQFASKSTISVNPVSPQNEYVDNSTREVPRYHVSASSVDTTGSSPLADPSLDLGVKHGDMAKSPMTRSYYAYDGSESSYDGTDEQTPEHIPPTFRRKSKDLGDINATEMQQKNRFRVNNTLNSDTEMNYWRPISSSILQEKQHRAVKGEHWKNRDEFIETKSDSRFTGNSTRLGGGASRFFASREFIGGHGSRSASNFHQNSLPPRPGFRSLDKDLLSVPDKIDLLRTVCELKDQLNRMQFPKYAPNMRYPAGIVKENYAPHYNDYLPPEMDMSTDLNHPGYHPRSKGWADRYNDPGFTFSEDVARYRHQVNCACLQCHPQDRRYLAQLPSNSIHCDDSHCVCGVHTVHNRHYVSSSSSPQQYLSSELSLWGHGTKFDNHRQRDEEIKRLYLKEKYQSAKRHLRPIAGGAPFLSCCYCSELLQLPEDLCLSGKTNHQFRCNSCSKVLKYSLLRKTHLVPNHAGASAPPPSEVEGYTNAIIPRSLPPKSRSESHQHVEPVSFSDEYGRSLDRNCSTEGDGSVGPSLVDVVNQQKDRKMKSTFNESTNRNKTPMATFQSVAPSSKGQKLKKLSSEIEEQSSSTNGTLHRLMGYMSPSQVFNK